MNNVVMDATILSTLMGCGALTDLRFNQNLQTIGGKSNAIEAGSIVHNFLEYYYGAIVEGKSKSDAIDIGVASAKLYINGCPICKELPIEFKGVPPCGHKLGDFIGVQNTPEESGKFDLGKGKKEYIGWKHCLDTCLQYLAFYANDQWIPLVSEHTKGKVIYQNDDISILWKAKFDLLVDTNQAILAVDHKTMSQRRDSLSLNNQFMGQCVLTESNNMVVNKIGFQKSLAPKEKFERALMSYSSARLDEWKNVIVPYWANVLVGYIKNNEWPRNFTHCETKYGFCNMREICESNPNMRDEVIRVNFIKGRAWDVTND